MASRIGTSRTIYFATNRDKSDANTKLGFGKRFHSDGAGFYRVGSAKLKKRSDDLDEGYEVTKITVAKEARKEHGDEQDLGSTGIFDSLRTQMAGQSCDAIIYIHGFANTFESALTRAAQLQEFYTVRPRRGGPAQSPLVFAFSWPSNGQVVPPWEYFSDRHDAEASGLAMARAMRRFIEYMATVENPCRQRIHLVAHSMGNWALRHAVQGLKQLSGGRRLETIIEHAFLMAADEDDDALEHEHKLGPLTELARHIHVYHSNDDGALVISDKTKFNPDRLGHNGPRTFSGVSTRVVAIDCQDVDDTESLQVNHQYYRRRPEVISDVRAVLAGRRANDIAGRIEVESGRRYRIRAKKRDKPSLTSPRHETARPGR